VHFRGDPKVAGRAGLTLAIVVATAAKLADSSGLEQVSLAAVATELGVRTPSLYNHVDGLPGLRRGLAIFGIRELGRRLGQAAIGKAGDDAIAAIAIAFRTFVNEHPGVYEATLKAPDLDDPVIQAEAAQVYDILFRVMQPYQLGDEGTVHAVRGLRSLAHGFATLEAAMGFGMAVPVDESYRIMVNTFLQGLRSN
jgi:AcrR family transcriptional regulator